MLGLFKIAGNLTDYLKERQLIEAGRAMLVKESLGASHAIITEAKEARAAAVAKFDDAGGVPDDDDPYRRD